MDPVKTLTDEHRVIEKVLDALEEQGWVRHTPEGWSLTPAGSEEARRKIIAVGGQEAS